jgi:hypothetical protein
MIEFELAKRFRFSLMVGRDAKYLKSGGPTVVFVKGPFRFVPCLRVAEHVPRAARIHYH